MTAIAYLVVLVVAVVGVKGEVVDMNCSDNATCIQELFKNVRQQKTVRVFDVLTIEPIPVAHRQARYKQGPLAKFFSTHAFTYDWNDFSFRLSRPQQRNDAIALEIFQGRSLPTEVKESETTVPKKSSSSSKVKDEDEEEDKSSKRLRRRQKKKVMQALIPMMFGMKSAGTVIFAMAVVTALTIKAFVASKLALIVTVGMALKRLYESYYTGVGLQNHPYLYSQYPIDFPSASSHQYTVSGMTPQFATSDVYNPTALASHSHTHEMLQQSDATAQQSQPAATVQLANATRATERWDGKSKLLKFLQPVIDGVRNFINPIANVFMDAMPATFRGLTSHVSTTKSKNEDSDEELVASASTSDKVVKAKEILVPQPRNIAQRKSAELRKQENNKPKKYNEMKFNLEKMKNNKDYNDYVKTKKYKYNYPQTHYYPRVRYYTNPNNYLQSPKNTNKPRKTITNNTDTRKPSQLPNNPNLISYNVTNNNKTWLNFSIFDEVNDWTPIASPELKRYTRNKRDLSFQTPNNSPKKFEGDNVSSEGRGFFDFFFKPDPIGEIFDKASKYTKSLLKSSVKPQLHSGPPKYYLITYDMVMFSLQVLDDFVQMKEAMYRHLFGHKLKKIKPVKITHKKKKKKKIIKKKKGSHHNQLSNQQNNGLSDIMMWRNNTKI